MLMLLKLPLSLQLAHESSCCPSPPRKANKYIRDKAHPHIRQRVRGGSQCPPRSSCLPQPCSHGIYSTAPLLLQSFSAGWLLKSQQHSHNSTTDCRRAFWNTEKWVMLQKRKQLEVLCFRDHEAQSQRKSQKKVVRRKNTLVIILILSSWTTKVEA